MAIKQTKNQKNVIYKFTNSINGKVYIGLTTKTFRKRYNSHKSSAFLPSVKHYDCKFYKAIRKFSWNSFKWEIIDRADSKEELEEKEKFWIFFYDSFKNGYNMTLGGEGSSGIVGEKHGQAKLTGEDVRKIKAALTKGVSQLALAKKYGVRQTNINCIATNKNWTHIEVDGWKEWQDLKARGEFIPPNYLQREKGSRHVNAKLTEEQVVVIKQKLMNKLSMDSIAKEFNVSKSPIYDIATNKSWIHVKVEGWSEYQAERSKGRIKDNKGSNNGMAKLSKEKVMEIKKMLVQGDKQRDIAQSFSLPISTVGSIAQGNTWDYIYVDGWNDYQAKRRKYKRVFA
ncbi:GIY-YIG nuclease family protein [Bacillus nitratireducens]|uniref:GIY-YIG nuclease family protein n=1 Tax=Bacillus nitratireducens TaxID=2026193 RepID=A0ABU6P8I1_9BACI|nr:GIY-YIG nuclease family protein [Bacillus nitratireducens]